MRWFNLKQITLSQLTMNVDDEQINCVTYDGAVGHVAFFCCFIQLREVLSVGRTFGVEDN